ncbi:MAG: hypothetical protein CMQ46_06900 [Gammaproteobacteria bacterium]|nr:hypothetical protein [Gammaproteobacteria bacterium]
MVKKWWSEFRSMLDDRTLLLSWLALALLVLGLHVYAELRLVQQRELAQRETLTDRLSVVRYQLESTLTNNLSLVNGLAAFISAYPEYTPLQFETYARTIMARESSLVNLAVAPDLVVTHVYPLAGNEAVIGLDYRQQMDQRDAVLRVVRGGAMVIAGPVNLVQGGVAFIGRAPVYVEDGGGQRLWGIVSAPILADAIYEQAGLSNPTPGMQLAIRGNDGFTSSEPFWGDSVVFNRNDAVIVPIIAGGSRWELASIPTRPAVSGAEISALRAASVLIFLLLSVFLILRHRHALQNQELRNIIFSNERFLRAVENVSRVGGWCWTGSVFTELSARTCEMMELPDDRNEVDMDTFCHTLDRTSQQSLLHYLNSALQLGHRLDQELEVHRKDGEVLWFQIKAEVAQLDGNERVLLGAVQDVTQQKKVDQLVEYQANYDMLTELPNRSLFIDRLENALLQAQRRSTRIAVLFIDLDNFKSVNDNLGHDAGDELLVEAARRIKSCVRAEDTVARHSGDEFVALLVDVFSTSVVSRVADRMVANMRKPFRIDERQIYCSVSIGVSFYPDDGDDADTLVIKADQAMYEVKKSGRNTWQFYTVAMQLESEQKHRLFDELVAAIDNDELEVFYQPVVDADSGYVSGCEALVRWQREDGNWVTPGAFIAIAEERGLINRIDLLVLRKSLKFIRELNGQLGRAVSLSVNVSPRLLHMRDDDAQDWLRELQMSHNVAVTIEITERVLVDETAGISKVLADIDSAGVRIAIDDFGTGYSGLSYFSRFPVSSVKIDRSFVKNLESNATETTLVETILLMASKLGIKVVAEGVETESQAAFLRNHRCDYLQGYHISPPLPGDDFSEFVRRNTSVVAEIH